MSIILVDIPYLYILLAVFEISGSSNFIAPFGINYPAAIHAATFPA